MIHPLSQTNPLAAGPGTYSKHPSRYPGNAPRYAVAGEGAYLIGSDGQQYLDLAGALGAVLLGHTDPHVVGAVQLRIGRGVAFSLGHEDEDALAHRLVRIIPGVEQIRFCLNGSDAVNAAVRVARAETNNDHVLFTGYHGFSDSYISTTSQCDGLVPSILASNTQIKWGAIDAVERIMRTATNVAAIVVEVPALPWGTPDAEITAQLLRYRTLAHARGAVFILDDVVTGFREALGGVQERYGVPADLVCFGKALANGYPLAAVAGPERLMRHLDPGQGGRVFMSATHAGHPLSVVAAHAVLDVLETTQALPTVHAWGRAIGIGLAQRFAIYRLPATLLGTSVRLGARWYGSDGAAAPHIQALWQQEMIAAGVLVGTGGWFPMTCYTAEDAQHCLHAAEIACCRVREALDTGTVGAQLLAPPAPQIFQRPL